MRATSAKTPSWPGALQLAILLLGAVPSSSSRARARTPTHLTPATDVGRAGAPLMRTAKRGRAAVHAAIFGSGGKRGSSGGIFGSSGVRATTCDAPTLTSTASASSSDGGPIDAEALFAEWQEQLALELGQEELSRWEREERKLSVWKRLVARSEKRDWRRGALELERAARAEVGRARAREADALAADNAIFSDDQSPAFLKAEANVARRGATDGARRPRGQEAAAALAWAARSSGTQRGSAAAAAQRALGAEVATTVGIDLGTTNSLVAVFQNGGPAVIEVSGQLVMPSAVAYVRSGGSGPTPRGGDGDGSPRAEPCAPLVETASAGADGVGVLVGSAASDYASAASGDAFRSVKRILGRRDLTAAELTQMRWLAPAARLLGAASPASGGSGELLLACRALSRPISATEVSAEILRALLDGACAALRRPVRMAVVTVPAHFSEAQRAATETACLLAGLTQVHLLREPEAAALAYGWDKRRDERCLVFDLGGGTFDVSIVDVGGDTIEIIATGGDVSLGGDDFDEAIAAHLTAQLVAESGLKPDAASRYRIICAAQDARHALSERQSVEVCLRGLTGMKGAHAASADLTHALSRRKMEGLTKGLLERLIPPIVKVASDAGIKLTLGTDSDDDSDGTGAALGRQSQAERARASVAWRWQRMARRWAAGNSKIQRFAPGVPISRVILVGGATRMPCIPRLIKRLTGLKPELTVDPETAVAEGAAVQAAILDGLPSAGSLAVFNPYHGGRLHQRRDMKSVGGRASAAAGAPSPSYNDDDAS